MIPLYNKRLKPDKRGRMTQEQLQILARKRRQRFIEYIVLIGFQGFFVTAFLRLFHPVLALSFAAVSFGLSWNLAQLREQRRTLDLRDSRRLVGDALESMILMLFLVIVGIGARFIGIPFTTVMAYLSASLMAYFIGAFLGESVWIKRSLADLPETGLHNYIANLNRSLFFPYNLSYLQQAFRSPRRRNKNDDK